LKIKISFIVFLLFVASCGQKSNEIPLAKVGSKYLYISDIRNIVPASISEADSISYVKNYIQDWVQQQVLSHYADEELNSKEKKFEQQIENYQRSLLIFSYENKYVRSHIDSIIKVKDIQNYYDTHKSDFELKSNIVKVNYVKLSKGHPFTNKIKQMLFSDKPNKKKIEQICQQNAENYFLDDNAWLMFEDILKEIPINTYNQEQFLQNNREIEIEDSSYVYIVKFKDFKIKDELSPITYEKENIQNIILNKRKMDLIEKLNKESLTKAKSEGLIEIY